MMVSTSSLRLFSSLLLLSRAISPVTAAPEPVWVRIINSLEQFAASSWLRPDSQSPVAQSPGEDNAAAAVPGTTVTSYLPAVTTTIYATTYTPLPLPAPWDIYYDEELDDDDEISLSAEELTKRQCLNSGVGNDGCSNSGNYNCGNYNSGNYNTGDYNSGNNNAGNGNSGTYNNANGNAGNGGGGNSNGVCGNVVISQSQAWVYPAPSTVVVNVAPLTQVVTVQAPQVYTSYVIYQQPPATTVIYQQPQVVNIVAQETYAPRGCAYWEALGYQCSGAVGLREMKVAGAWGLAAAWGVWLFVI